MALSADEFLGIKPKRKAQSADAFLGIKPSADEFLGIQEEQTPKPYAGLTPEQIQVEKERQRQAGTMPQTPQEQFIPMPEGGPRRDVFQQPPQIQPPIAQAPGAIQIPQAMQMPTPQQQGMQMPSMPVPQQMQPQPGPQMLPEQVEQLRQSVQPGEMAKMMWQGAVEGGATAASGFTGIYKVGEQIIKGEDLLTSMQTATDAIQKGQTLGDLLREGYEPQTKSVFQNFVAYAGRDLTAWALDTITNPKELAELYLWSKGIGMIRRAGVTGVNAIAEKFVDSPGVLGKLSRAGLAERKLADVLPKYTEADAVAIRKFFYNVDNKFGRGAADRVWRSLYEKGKTWEKSRVTSLIQKIKGAGAEKRTELLAKEILGQVKKAPVQRVSEGITGGEVKARLGQWGGGGIGKIKTPKGASTALEQIDDLIKTRASLPTKPTAEMPNPDAVLNDITGAINSAVKAAGEYFKSVGEEAFRYASGETLKNKIIDLVKKNPELREHLDIQVLMPAAVSPAAKPAEVKPAIVSEEAPEEEYVAPTAEQEETARILGTAELTKEEIAQGKQASVGRLISSIAKTEQRGNPSISFADLVQAGNIGTMKAYKNYIPGETKFSTYAYKSIRSAIREEIARQKNLITYPQSVRRKLNRVYKAIFEIQQDTGIVDRIPPTSRIAARTGMLNKEIDELLSTQLTRMEKLEQQEEGQKTTYIETLPGTEARQVEITEIKDRVSHLTKGLSERELQIIDLKYGLTSGSTMNVRDIADEFKISKTRVGQIIDIAISKMKARAGITTEATDEQITMLFEHKRALTETVQTELTFGTTKKRDAGALEMIKNMDLNKEREQVVLKEIKIKHIKTEGWKITDDKSAVKFVNLIRHPGIEHFTIIYTDKTGKIITYKVFSSGAVDYVDVKELYPILSRDMKADPNIVNFWIGHNHPSGNPEASTNDRILMKALTKIPKFAGHIITDHKTYTSIGKDGSERLKQQTQKLEDWSGVESSIKSINDIANSFMALTNKDAKMAVAILTTKQQNTIAAELINEKDLSKEMLDKLEKKYGASNITIVSNFNIKNPESAGIKKSKWVTEYNIYNREKKKITAELAEPAFRVAEDEKDNLGDFSYLHTPEETDILTPTNEEIQREWAGITREALNIWNKERETNFFYMIEHGENPFGVTGSEDPSLPPPQRAWIADGLGGEWDALPDFVKKKLNQADIRSKAYKATHADTGGTDRYTESMGIDDFNTVIDALHKVKPIGKRPTVAGPVDHDFINHYFTSPEGQKALRDNREGGITSKDVKEEIARMARIMIQWDEQAPIIQPTGNSKVPVAVYRRTVENTQFKKDNSPMQWAGAKDQMLGYILNILGLPSELNKVTAAGLEKLSRFEYVYDVFGGSGYMTLLAQELFKDAETNLNELDADMQKIWATIKTNPEGVKARIAELSTWIHMPMKSVPVDWWNHLKEKFGKYYWATDELWTAATILKNNTGRDTTTKISPTKVHEIWNSITPYSRKLNKANIEQRDAIEIIDEALKFPQNKAEKTLLILDPPYLWTSGYKHGANFERPAGFMELLDKLEQLNKKGISFMFFNSEPASVFPRVIYDWSQYLKFDEMQRRLNELAEMPGMTVLRMVAPAGVASSKFVPRKEIIITNLETGGYKAGKIKKLPWSKVSDYIKVTKIGIELIGQEIKGAPIENPLTTKQKRMIAVLAKNTPFQWEGDYTHEFRQFAERTIGKKRLTLMTETEGKELISAIMKYKKINREITNRTRTMNMSPALLKQQIHSIFPDKRRISELNDEQLKILNESLTLYEHTESVPMLHLIRYTSDWLGTWAGRQKSPAAMNLYHSFKSLEANTKDGREWRLKLIQQFREVFEGMNAKQREKIFNFMHRPKGTTMAEFMAERETYGLTDAEKKAALQARELWNRLFKAAGMKGERYWKEYQPLIFRMLKDPDTVIKEFRHLPKKEVEMFFEKQRIAEGDFILAGAEQLTDPIELFEIYSAGVVKKKYIWPAAANVEKYFPLVPKTVRNAMSYILNDLLGKQHPLVEQIDAGLQRAVQAAIDNKLGRAVKTEEALNWLGFTTRGRMIDGNISTLRDLVYADLIGTLGSAIKNTTQETHIIAEYGGVKWSRAAWRSKTAKGRQETDEADIYTLGVGVKFSKGKGAIGEASQVMTTLFRAKDKGSRQKAYLCGIITAEDWVPKYEAGKITADELASKLKFTLRTDAQYQIGMMVILDDPKAYTEPVINNLTKRVRDKILKLKETDPIAAKIFYLGHLSGYWAQAMTQYPYYAEETEALYRGPAGKLLGTFGTWPPRFAAMVNRWAHGGADGRKAFIRYILQWILIITAGSTMGINFKKWIGPASWRIGNGFATVLGAPGYLALAISSYVGSIMTDSKWDLTKANDWMYKMRGSIRAPGQRQIKSTVEALTTPGLTDWERLKIFTQMPQTEEFSEKRRKIKRDVKKAIKSKSTYQGGTVRTGSSGETVRSGGTVSTRSGGTVRR
ncbi:sigma-70 family RNA polymerase sigma factor [bacterium]|nr:sigma-70 family RNA polymerase sigma factor [Candidatus Omnitrophota bacterium]MBA3065560.1 sigma-70 family RNA polymerase sigma factor [bacterium]